MVSDRPRPFALVLLATSLPMFMATLDNLVVTNALPLMYAELGASVEQLQWFVNAYTLSFAAAILLAVGLGDRYGRRTVFAAGIALFTAGSTFAALSSTPSGVIAARTVQGFGAAALLPLSLALLTGAVPPSRRPLAIGIWGGISGLGVAVGPLVGGAILQQSGWQTIFWLNVPIGLLVLPLVLRALPNPTGARLPLDLPGAVLAGLGVLGIVLGIVRGNEAGWTSGPVLIPLIGGTCAIGLFVLRQFLATAPLLPLRLFRNRSFTVANFVGFGFSFGIFGAIFILVQFLQVVRGATPLEAAAQTTPWTLAPLLVAPLTGLLVPRAGTRALIVTGLALQAAALSWLAVILSPAVTYAALVTPFALAGIGMGLVLAPSATAVLATLVDLDYAKASGTYSTFREIGVALGIAVLTAVFTGNGGVLTPTGYVDAAIPAISVGAAVLLAAAVLATALPSRLTPPPLTLLRAEHTEEDAGGRPRHQPEPSTVNG